MTASAAASPRLFAVPDFRRLWCVGLIVFLVRWLELLAVSLFVYQATGSAFLVTMMGMLRILPMGLFGAVMGAMAERVEARTVPWWRTRGVRPWRWAPTGPRRRRACPGSRGWRSCP